MSWRSCMYSVYMYLCTIKRTPVYFLSLGRTCRKRQIVWRSMLCCFSIDNVSANSSDGSGIPDHQIPNYERRRRVSDMSAEMLPNDDMGLSSAYDDLIRKDVSTCVGTCVCVCCVWCWLSWRNWTRMYSLINCYSHYYLESLIIKLVVIFVVTLSITVFALQQYICIPFFWVLH